MKRLPWSWALLALAGAAACTPAPRPPSVVMPPALPPAEVEKPELPLVRPYDPDIPEARPTTPVESAPLPPPRRR
ncbi:MAG: hypothetical protein ABIO39_00790 [Caulobacteraceae bacterium]